ncbi:sensor histidine kinase [Pseudoduganella violacea]|uniref:histidine kinase n=1 Tax=Pseudoduganella violacea TaxID=1715466 RepID=A0A7W5BD14_9BURK|nr:sensor histidine kinase [Pseudoduganella violacea]MBB3120883.1 two-component system sensor histidine kinase TctE [Pseudoduganella violacea]
MPSIRLRLLKWLIAPILLINLAGGALTYALAWVPAQRAFDDGLSDAARALAARLSFTGGALQLDLPPQAEKALRSGASDAVYFAVRQQGGGLLAGDPDLLLTAFEPQRELTTTQTQAQDGNMRGAPVRIAVHQASVEGRRVTIAVAKTLRERVQARQAIFRALMLLEALLTLSAVGLIWFSVSTGLRPLNRLRSELNARGGAELEAIPPTNVPYELEPVVTAFNGLLERVSEGAQAQQHFLANVAHQLRTPLAGLQAQLEWLGQREGGPAADPGVAQSLRLMLSSTERMIRQTNQLLALARAEPSHFEKTRLEALALDRLVEESIQPFVEQAARKDIDLGFDLHATNVMGDRFLLRDLIDNLIDNAIRYTPAHGRVTVSCRREGEGGVLAVEDSGPGIPPAKREAVFNRFVRLDEKTAGSGLGLAIVRDIATAHGASVAIDSAPGGQGVLISVRFPP